MRHKRTQLAPERRYGWPTEPGAMREEPLGSWVYYGEWHKLRTEVLMCMFKLRRAASYLRPCAFVATYPDGSYLLDPQWSRERAQWHKSKGARITRIRGVMEEW